MTTTTTRPPRGATREADHLRRLDKVIRTVITPALSGVRAGQYPRGAIRALGRIGILGLTVAPEFGGGGRGLSDAVEVVHRIAQVCPATAAILARHYAAVAVLEAHAPAEVRTEIGTGHHLSTLALTDVDGGPNMWSCTGTATIRGPVTHLNSHKRCVISAGEADSYVWSTRAVSDTPATSLWLVAGSAPGLHVPAETHPALPGTSCADILADPAAIPTTSALGPDATGRTILLETAVPWFTALNGLLDLGRSHP